jgi:hypothetical protein
MLFTYRLQSDCAQLATLWSWQFGSPQGHCGAPPANRTSAPSSPFSVKALLSFHADNRKARTFFKRILKPTALAMATAAAGVSLTLGTLASTHAWSAAAYPLSYWQTRMDWVLRPSVRDADNHLIGFMPPPNATNLEAEHAAEPGPIAPSCIDLVQNREDAHNASSWRYVFGVDLGSITRAVLTQRGGASTIPMQLARQLANWPAKYTPWERKVNEAGAAQTLIDLHAGDHRKIAETYLAIAPFASAFGDVRGIAAASDILFARSPANLTRAQCALLVTMLPTRPSLVINDARAKKAWELRREQAVALLRRVPGEHVDADIAEAVSWHPMPPLRSKFEDQPEAVTFNLGARTRAFVLPHLARIASDLNFASGSSEAPGTQPTEDVQ